MAGLTVMCTFRVKKGKERAFVGLLKKQRKVMRKLDLATAEPAKTYRGRDDTGRPFFVEIFSWKNEAAVGAAHRHPEVMAVWGPMGRMVEARKGRPAMEFPHVEPVKV
jgi:hypothetical protein